MYQCLMYRCRFLFISLCCISPFVQSAEESSAYLFKNVNVFDGVNQHLKSNQQVLVLGGTIAQVSKNIEAPAGGIVIDGQGRTLMPGMIDVHAHLAIAVPLDQINGGVTPEENAILSTLTARSFIDDGFTTVRDVGGYTFALKKSIDAGLIPGPRIFPAGAFLSQTSGHGDFRDPADEHPATGHITGGSRLKMGVVVDGRAEVLRAVRENLRQGATQIKIMASGGAGSDFDPIDSVQFTAEEQRAAVQAAADWGTYVTAHLLNDKAMNRALDNGVMCLDHAFTIEDATMKKLVEKGAFLAPQFNAMSVKLQKTPGLKALNIKKIADTQKKMTNLLPLIKKYQPKIPFAVDAVGVADSQTQQRRFELYYVAKLFGAYEALKRATSVSGELVAMSGKRNVYGKLGVIEPGALADILLVDGNPLEDISLVGADKGWWDASVDEIKTMPFIMKNGKVYRNRL